FATSAPFFSVGYPMGRTSGAGREDRWGLLRLRAARPRLHAVATRRYFRQRDSRSSAAGFGGPAFSSAKPNETCPCKAGRGPFGTALCRQPRVHVHDLPGGLL